MKLWPLESIRGMAALYVVIHHARIFDRGGLGSLFYFGQEAVILFFLLSGFVIEYSVSRRKTTVKDYLRARAVRIYPLFVMALLAAYLADSVSRGEFSQPNWTSMLGNLLMLQDVSALKPGVWIDTFSGNSPLWSLSYEWWFYMAYIPIALIHPRGRSIKLWMVGTISLAGFIAFYIKPAQPFLFMNYLLIWWLGSSMAEEFSRTGSASFTGQRVPLVLTAIMAALWVFIALEAQKTGSALGFGIYPVLQIRHFTAALLIAVTGILWSKICFKGATVLLRPFAKMGAISYAIYVLHQPALNLAAALLPTSSVFVRFSIACAALLPVAWLAEAVLQPKIAMWINSLGQGLHRSTTRPTGL